MSAIAGRASTTDFREPIPELAGARVLLVHHWLYAWAGAERCLEQFVALVPGADIVAGVIAPAMREEHPVAARARETWLGRVPGARSHHRWFLPLHALAFASLDTSGYDLVISISHAFEKATRARKPGARHLCYCLTPPRYLWDLDEAHDELARPAQRAALAFARPLLRTIDQHSARRVDRFVAISRHVAGRVHRYYHREASVVYPPVAARPVPSDAAPGTGRPYLLTLGRLVPYKRVDLAIIAAELLRMPLIVAGDGPDRLRLERLAGPMTTFAGAVSEDEAARLLSGCTAFVFCAEEDFGIAPVEASAYGVPVVAFGRGGAAETIVDGRTGILFSRQAPEAVADAIRRCLEQSWDPAVIREQAARFAPERFRAEMRVELARVMR